MASCPFSHQLRQSSAILVAKEREAEIAKAMPESVRIAELEAALAQSKSDHLDFPFSLDYLHKTSGIVNKSQVKTAVTRDFQEERDYIEGDGQIFLNESTFTILIMSFRSLAGTDITALPEVIQVETKRYFEYQQIRRMNRRIARGECPGQTALDL